jgi:hypothetical protein
MGGDGLMFPKLFIDFTKPFTVPTGSTGVQCSRSGNAWSVSNGVLNSNAANTLRYVPEGLLVEPGRTNYLLYSRDLTNAAWSASSMTVSNITGMDRVSNSASKIVFSPSGGNITQSLTLGVNTYTFSAYIKVDNLYPGSPTLLSITIDGTTWQQVASMPGAAGLNGWFLVSITSTLANPTIGFKADNNNVELYVDCCQLEASRTPTSPILTTTGPVSRNSDVVYIDINQANSNCWFNNSMGTFVVTGRHYNLYTDECSLFLGKVSGPSDIMNLSMDRNPTFELSAFITSSFDYTFFRSCDNPGQQYAAAFAYTQNEQLASLNGRTPLTPSGNQSMAFDFSHIDRVWIGCAMPGNNEYGGVISKLVYYPLFLQQTDLNTLTT